MNFLNKLSKSRGIILEMLTYRGYDVSEYANFSNTEIEIMYTNMPIKILPDKQALDIIVKNGTGNSIYVKYLFNSKIKITNITTLILQMKKEYDMKDNDTVVIITKDKSYNKSSGSDDILEGQLEALYQKEKIFTQAFWLDTLIINILDHVIVPEHRIMSQEAKEALLDRYNITHFNQLPLIMKTDPVAKFIGMKRGDVCEITLASETSGKYNNYRYCQ
jgi:DNA-directed RNA polymerases I, II, and III subunit RPABC1